MTMAMELRWVGEGELDRVGETRTRCYAHGLKDLEGYKQGMRADVRGKPGDFLLAVRDGEAVGTATSLSMTMWVRGGAVPCQGVAWVGTVKTHRRHVSGDDGVATQVMREALRMARDRGQVVSALMPFRASFYEHFGYGLVEQRNEWTLPLAVLPHGSFEGIRFYQQNDLDELTAFHQRVIAQGQCEIERSHQAWAATIPRTESGFLYIDRAENDGPVHGFLWLEHEKLGTKDHLRIIQNNYADLDALKRQLHFLASLRDQYSAVVGAFPPDFPLNLLLRETQLPHRPVNHAHAELRPHTRMQARILDHKRFLEALKLPAGAKAKTVVAVHESEGTTNTFMVDIADGRAAASPTQATAEFSCTDRVWATVACGHLSATSAAKLGLAHCSDLKSRAALDVLSHGPLPFCHEYF
jgi:predicted acetyltransferase